MRALLLLWLLGATLAGVAADNVRMLPELSQTTAWDVQADPAAEAGLQHLIAW